MYPDGICEVVGNSSRSKNNQVQLVVFSIQHPLTISIPRTRPAMATTTTVGNIMVKKITAAEENGKAKLRSSPVGLLGNDLLDNTIHAVGIGGAVLSDGTVDKAEVLQQHQCSVLVELL